MAHMPTDFELNSSLTERGAIYRPRTQGLGFRFRGLGFRAYDSQVNPSETAGRLEQRVDIYYLHGAACLSYKSCEKYHMFPREKICFVDVFLKFCYVIFIKVMKLDNLHQFHHFPSQKKHRIMSWLRLQ